MLDNRPSINPYIKSIFFRFDMIRLSPLHYLHIAIYILEELDHHRLVIIYVALKKILNTKLVEDTYIVSQELQFD